MKLLENSSFEAINYQLCIETGDSNIIGRIESYSCKMAGDDKHMFKQFCQDGQPHVLEALSPPQTSAVSPSRLSKSGEDAESPLSDKCCRKTLFYLIATLNESFRPDYDFSTAKSHEFSREPSLNWVVNAVNSSLFSAVGEEFNNLKPELWNALDQEICLQECDIYSYNPDLDSDPFGEDGSLWSFNYFFYNKKLKRIVFFTCRSVSFMSGCGRDSLGNELDMELEDEMDDETDNFEEDRIESYSCKMAGDDKHMFKQFCQDGQPHVLEALSPPQTSAVSPSRLSKSGEDAESPLSDKCCRKTLFYLIATLNESFRPDYDFSTAKSHEFSREPSLNWTKGRGAWPKNLENRCTIKPFLLGYNPDLDSDPFGEDGSLWSFNYFFYNKKLKRIVFFTCRSVSFMSGCGRDSLGNELDMELEDEMDDETDNFEEDRKTLFYLIATLNESFRPDYDFSTAKSHEFSREPSLNWVRLALPDRAPGFHTHSLSMLSHERFKMQYYYYTRLESSAGRSKRLSLQRRNVLKPDPISICPASSPWYWQL
ncbi:UNVERIFIED_CONTAM: hypothetical protein FKN15_050892 [Acipenser sinensis]